MLCWNYRKGQAAVVVGHKIYSFGGEINQVESDYISKVITPLTRLKVHVFNTVSLLEEAEST